MDTEHTELVNIMWPLNQYLDLIIKFRATQETPFKGPENVTTNKR